MQVFPSILWVDGTREVPSRSLFLGISRRKPIHNVRLAASKPINTQIRCRSASAAEPTWMSLIKYRQKELHLHVLFVTKPTTWVLSILKTAVHQNFKVPASLFSLLSSTFWPNQAKLEILRWINVSPFSLTCLARLLSLRCSTTQSMPSSKCYLLKNTMTIWFFCTHLTRACINTPLLVKNP